MSSDPNTDRTPAPDAVSADETSDDTGATTGPKGREVVLPMRLYKTVTVFSTLFAVAGVVLGFVVLDAATNRAQASLGEIDVGLALAGLGSIAVAALVYAFATRFRASGMGKSKTDDP
jgi:hypothetical protein